MPNLNLKDWIILTIVFSVVSYCYKNFEAPSNIDFLQFNKITKTNDVKLEYWNGDLNCPIFTARDDGSMLAFSLKSARKSEQKLQYGNAAIIFDGYEVEYDGNYNIYGEYALLYNEEDKFYYVYYPRSWRFPNGAQFQVENLYQINVCKKLIQAVNKFKFI